MKSIKVNILKIYQFIINTSNKKVDIQVKAIG